MQVVLLHIHGILISTTWQGFLENKQHAFSPHIISQVRTLWLKNTSIFFFLTKEQLAIICILKYYNPHNGKQLKVN